MSLERFWILVTVGGLLLLPACGGGMAPDPMQPEYEAESPVELDHEQAAAVEQLETALALTEPDCASVCQLSDRICELGARICEIADRHPEDDETAGRCRDGSERCDRARERVVESCPCAP